MATAKRRHDASRNDRGGAPQLPGANVLGRLGLQASSGRTEPARGTDQHQPIDNVGMIGSQLLGDAPAGRRSHHGYGAVETGTQGLRVFARDIAHRHSAGEPGAPIEQDQPM